MDKRFIAHRDYIENRANISCVELQAVLAEALPRRLDTLEKIDDLPSDLSSAGYDDGNCVPLGDLSWVSRWLSLLPSAADPDMTPLEIPKSLVPFACRYYETMRGSDIPCDLLDGKKYFLKDVSHLKRWNSLLYEGDLSRFIDPDVFYSISEKVDFLSEWRVFVYEDIPQAAQNYLGDPLIFPDRERIYDMIRAYRDSGIAHPRAYTVDVGIISKENDSSADKLGHVSVPIEVHPFVACGLYGFSDRVIADMLVAGYEWYAKEAPGKRIV